MKILSLLLCLTAAERLSAADPALTTSTLNAAGGTSAFLLRALERNESGRLFSIDYLIPGVQPFGHPLGQGCLVPKRLQANWTLINGDSREELPKLLAKLGSINFFLHDSLHTYKHMSWEYKTAWQAMASGGILTSHDIALTNAFQDFMSGQKHEATGSALICNVGVMCKR